MDMGYLFSHLLSHNEFMLLCSNYLFSLFFLAQASNTFNVMSEPPPLEYHKWRIESHDKVEDVTQCG